MSNISSIITLKSELNKRKAALSNSNSKAKFEDLYSFNKSSIKVADNSKSFKKPKIESVVDVKKELEYKKTLENLERKSKLYDKLINENDKVCDNEFLVDFNKKVRHNSVTCDSQNIKSTNIPFSNEIKDLNKEIKEDTEFSYYTNVLNTEIREHGIGYYKFSSNIEERKEQLNELKKFQAEIDKEKMNLIKINELEKDKLQSRLEKIKSKYNADVPVDDLLPIIKPPEDSEDILYPDIKEDTINDLLSEIRANTQPKSKREWDRGKRPNTFENIQKNIRNDRNPNFAPPKSY